MGLGTAWRLACTRLDEEANPDCPWVRRYHDESSGNTSLHEAHSYAAPKDLVWLAVNLTALKQQLGGKPVDPENTPHCCCSAKYADWCAAPAQADRATPDAPSTTGERRRPPAIPRPRTWL